MIMEEINNRKLIAIIATLNAYLKMTGLIEWSWIVLLSPVWIVLLYNAVYFALLHLSTFKDFYAKRTYKYLYVCFRYESGDVEKYIKMSKYDVDNNSISTNIILHGGEWTNSYTYSWITKKEYKKHATDNNK